MFLFQVDLNTAPNYSPKCLSKFRTGWTTGCKQQSCWRRN